MKSGSQEWKDQNIVSRDGAMTEFCVCGLIVTCLVGILFGERGAVVAAAWPIIGFFWWMAYELSDS